MFVDQFIDLDPVLFMLVFQLLYPVLQIRDTVNVILIM